MTKKYTYGEWLKEWLNVYKKPFVKSVRNQKIIIRLHIPEYVKAQRLSDLNVVDVQRSINTVTHSRTRVDVFNLYHGSLALAYKLRLLPYDIERNTKKGRKGLSPPRRTRYEEIQGILPRA